MRKSIGYIICETASVEYPRSRIVSKDGADRPIIEANLQDMNVTNRNNRYYSSDELVPQLRDPRIVELLETGNFHGEAGHPQSKDISRQQIIDINNMSHKFLKIWTEGNDILAHIRAADSNKGDEFNRYILGGAKPSFSLRALGSVINTRNGAEVKNIRIITWDWVIYPSHKSAYMRDFVNITESGIITEGNNLLLSESDKGIMEPLYADQVRNYIKEESMNIRSVMNTFNIIAESIEYNPKNNKVTMTGIGGEHFSIRLENHIRHEIMEHCDKDDNRFWRGGY